MAFNTKPWSNEIYIRHGSKHPQYIPNNLASSTYGIMIFGFQVTMIYVALLWTSELRPPRPPTVLLRQRASTCLKCPVGVKVSGNVFKKKHIIIG